MSKANPGSPEAKRDGCSCPVIDNHHGKGLGGDGEKYGWVVVLTCEMHTRSDAYPSSFEAPRWATS